MKILCALILVANVSQAQKVKTMNLVPGKSLGDVSIGEERAALIKKGFVVDELRKSFLKRDGVSVRIETGTVSQIWLEGVHLDAVRWKGKKLPVPATLKSLKKFFGNCEPPVTGSGGELLHCENRGLEFSTSFGDPSIDLSVTSGSDN